jgi:hypothetical protein
MYAWCEGPYADFAPLQPCMRWEGDGSRYRGPHGWQKPWTEDAPTRFTFSAGAR